MRDSNFVSASGRGIRSNAFDSAPDLNTWMAGTSPAMTPQKHKSLLYKRLTLYMFHVKQANVPNEI